MRGLVLTLGAALALGFAVQAEAADEPFEPTPPKPHAGPVGYSALPGNYLAGRFAYRQRDVSSASQYYQLVLAEDSENRALVQRTLVLTVQDGRIGDAVRLAKRLVALDPKSKIGHLVLIVNAVAEGRLEQAFEQLNSIERNGIYELMAPIMEGWVQLGRGNFDAAMAAIEPLSTKQAFEMYHAYHGALMAMLSDSRDIAVKNYDVALTAVPGGTLRVVMAYGIYLRSLGRTEEATTLYENYREHNPDSPWLDSIYEAIHSKDQPDQIIASAQDGLAEALFGAASALPNESGGDTGLIYAHLALHLRPDFPVAQLLVGEVLDVLERYEDAITSYSAIPKESPYSWSARLRAASGLAAIERIDEAVVILAEMVEERPGRSDAAIALADVLRRNDRYSEAVDYYDIAIERTGDHEARHWSLFYSRGVMLERTKRWPRAEADFLYALELQPDQPLVLNYLGYSWVEQGTNLERAMELIERAVALRPTDGYIVDSLGWAFYRLGNYEKAVKHLERAVELRADDPIITDHLGDIYWKVGRQNEARFQWERSLVLGAEEEAANLIRQKLKDGVPDEPKASQ
ncbi:MAG: tetratricopeptide repeat protein [Rhodospirillaceae bacterium]|mgnify:CR=1 FL=1|nr:tetratricopeptide repeat protein [Rhodospirillaceae bacterium]MBT3926999.1 tetratricopeptide repeat protein [Rhodospirillaceae bacterium]MBT5038169.1 tetratricopeptide repeat protein [Rhodospirillaceae bacterium]MBT5675176.1 tetratricopeptide repeat protein [Rhodospirillaceae bacterium]MBT5780031.1 tetratricopeptide repeat protein [Rhodospirillaceae bacterium]